MFLSVWYVVKDRWKKIMCIIFCLSVIVFVELLFVLFLIIVNLYNFKNGRCIFGGFWYYYFIFFNEWNINVFYGRKGLF